MSVATQLTDQILLDRLTRIEFLTVAVVVVLEWAAPHARIHVNAGLQRSWSGSFRHEGVLLVISSPPMLSVRALRQTLRFFVNPVQRESDFLYRCVRCLLVFQRNIEISRTTNGSTDILRFVSRSSCCPDEEVSASLSAVAPRSRCAAHLMSLHEQQFVDCGDVVSEV